MADAPGMFVATTQGVDACNRLCPRLPPPAFAGKSRYNQYPERDGSADLSHELLPVFSCTNLTKRSDTEANVNIFLLMEVNCNLPNAQFYLAAGLANLGRLEARRAVTAGLAA